MDHAPQLIVGTAGHIDHGKSRLVLALTGTDPDRLPEEKARGMTIDLGFGYVRIDDCDVWFVDVPGHERFVRNMVAGAAGVDLALLIVAADDSVMPQTREHAELLSLLGVRELIVVITKTDLVDRGWAEEVEREARELLAGLDLAPIAVVHTSAESGAGLDALRAAISQRARQRRSDDVAADWFLLPVDRSFTVAGRGAVVTGSVAHGQVGIGAELELWPGPRRVRVRGLQSHHVGRAEAAGRMRLAVNLAGVAAEDAHRGCVLSTPGFLEPASVYDVWIATLRMPGRARRRRLRLRLHTATSELLAELRLLDPPAEPTLRGVFGQLLAAEPLVATGRQRFVLRDEAGTRTIGGGMFLCGGVRRWTARHPPDVGMLRALLDGPLRSRLEAIIRGQGWRECDTRRLAARLGVASHEQVAAECERVVAERRVHRLESAGAGLFIHADVLAEIVAFLERRLREHLAQHARSPGVPLGEWPRWMPRGCPARLRGALADWLISEGRFAIDAGHVTPRGHKPRMAAADERLYEALLAEFRAGGFSPPAVEALTCRTPQSARRIDELLKLAAVRGELVRVGDGVWLHHERRAELVETVVAALRRQGSLTVAQMRDLLGTTRKYMVPIAEHLDATGITRRFGDDRRLGPNAPPARSA